jgi:hypothetical protein
MNSEVEAEGNCCRTHVTRHSVHIARRRNGESNASIMSATVLDSKEPEMRRVSDERKSRAEREAA